MKCTIDHKFLYKKTNVWYMIENNIYIYDNMIEKIDW